MIKQFSTQTGVKRHYGRHWPFTKIYRKKKKKNNINRISI